MSDNLVSMIIASQQPWNDNKTLSFIHRKQAILANHAKIFFIDLISGVEFCMSLNEYLMDSCVSFRFNYAVKLPLIVKVEEYYDERNMQDHQPW